MNTDQRKSKFRIDLNETQEVKPFTGQTRRLYSVEIEPISSAVVSADALLLGLERVFSVL